MGSAGRIRTWLNAPQPYLTDGGLETHLIFHDGVDLPFFAAFTELDNAAGRERLRRYHAGFIDAARAAGTGYVLDTPTWRANTAWGHVMGLDEGRIRAVNRGAADFVRDLRTAHEPAGVPVVLNGVIGPAADGYAPDEMLSAEAARDIHLPQISELAQAGVDCVSAVTMTHAGEAIGAALAADACGIPVVVSFTVETDGCLPSGQRAGDAIAEADAATKAAPLFYMINCAHPDHFRDELTAGSGWLERIGGLRANASRMSHAELDAATELDDGDPHELAADYQRLHAMLPELRLLGGCCGTDHRHVAAIASACIGRGGAGPAHDP